MDDKLRTGYKLIISVEAKANLKNFRHMMGHESINETVEWMFENPEEGAERLATLAVVLNQFKE